MEMYILLIVILFLICEITLFTKNKEKFNNSQKNNSQKYEKIPNNFRNFNKLKIDNYDNHSKCFTCPQKKN